MQLCLSEFVVWYDYSGRSKSEEIFELYDNKLEKIKVSDVETLDNNCKLPEFIISESKSVMTKRKTPKVVFYLETYLIQSRIVQPRVRLLGRPKNKDPSHTQTLRSG